MFEICTKPGEVSDSSQDDRYEDDESYPKKSGAIPGVEMGMRVDVELRENQVYTEPDYNYKLLGGVCWDLLAKLKSKTKFTNSEIRHEGMNALFLGRWSGLIPNFQAQHNAFGSGSKTIGYWTTTVKGFVSCWRSTSGLNKTHC